jgi:hypothetical protein
VEAPGLIPDKTAFMGNIESGAAGKGDMYVFVGTLDMTDAGTARTEDKYGMTNGKVLLVYEDQYGQEYTEEFEFSTTINPPVIMVQEEPEEEEPPNQNQWWISVVTAAAIIAALLGIRGYARKRQARIREDEEPFTGAKE